nr:BPSS1780 family membrane protein [Ramlibacter agri]
MNIVPARTGIQWVKLGVQAFFRQPLGLTGLVFMYGAVYALLAAIPLVGVVALAVLTPAATLGMFVATERVSNGTFPMPSVFLAGFRSGSQCSRSMLILGAIHVGVLVVLLGALTLFFPGAPIEITEATGSTPAQVQVSPMLFVASALQLPLLVLFAFAPALVYWHGVAPVKSLFFSAIAFWRNLRAFFVYAAAWVLLLSALLLLLLLVSAGNRMVMVQFLAPFSLVFLGMLFTSLYFSFRDTFVATPPPETS